MAVLWFVLVTLAVLGALEGLERLAAERQHERLEAGLEECRECGETAHHEIDGVPLCDPCAEMHEEEMCA